MSIQEQHYATMMYPLLLRTIPDQMVKMFVLSLPEKAEVRTDTIRDPTTERLGLPEVFAQRLRAIQRFIMKEIETEEQTEEFRRSQDGKGFTSRTDKSSNVHC